MKTKMLLVGLVFVFFAVPSQAIMSSIGPSFEGEEGQVTVGVDYFRSREDVKLDSATGWYGSTSKIMELQTSGTYANIGYYLTDNCKVYIRAGVSQAQNEGVGQSDYYDTTNHLKGTSDAFSGGVGIRWAKKVDSITWAAQGQMMYHSFGFHSQGYEDYCYDPEISGKAKLYSAQLIFSGLYQINNYLSVYGGPVFNFVGGSLDVETKGKYGYGWSEEMDVSERSNVGAHAGAVLDVWENVSLVAEGGLQASSGSRFSLGGQFLIP